MSASTTPISDKIDGRKSALAHLKRWETEHLLQEASVLYLARSPQFACGMLAGFRLALHVLRDSQQGFQYLRQLTEQDAA
jgi:hypothetical protein